MSKITDAERARARRANEAIRAETARSAAREAQAATVDTLVNLLGGWARERPERIDHAALEKALNDSNNEPEVPS